MDLLQLRNGAYGHHMNDSQSKAVSIDFSKNLAWQNPYRTSNVLASKALLEHILSYIPIECISLCAVVSKDWYLILKYIVPIPLIHLKTLSMGELLYWLPAEDKLPKTVVLKVKFSSGVPTASNRGRFRALSDARAERDSVHHRRALDSD